MGRRRTSPTYANDTATSATLPGVSTLWTSSTAVLAAVAFHTSFKQNQTPWGARTRTSLPPGRLALFKPLLGPPALTTSSGPRPSLGRTNRCLPSVPAAAQLCQVDESGKMAALPVSPRDLLLERNSRPAWELHAVMQPACACPGTEHSAAAVTMDAQESALA